jgi:ABC-type branched-subunit amino acid transport system ATPase component
LLLLDEPAAGLPSAEADEIIGRVLEIARAEGMTVVIIEHNVELVANVSDRVIVLDAGSVIADGTPEQALTHPAVIAAYLGA